MGSGIRATVTFTGQGLCPITDLSRKEDTTIDSTATNVWSAKTADCVTEFSMAAEYDPDPEDEFETVFSHGGTQRYRYVHKGEATCPCESIGEFGCPIVRYVARNGTLTLVFHATDYEQLQELVAELRDRFPGVNIERLVRSPNGEQPGDSVLIDKGKLTSRQLEVLETAHEMGYFERPRRSNATEVAKDLDINPSTLSEHLAAAQSKILGDLL